MGAVLLLVPTGPRSGPSAPNQLPVGVVTGAFGGVYLPGCSSPSGGRGTYERADRRSGRRTDPRLRPARRHRRDLSVEIPDGSFTVIVGPNACGKSTLLRALARMLKPRRRHGAAGRADIASLPAKKVARGSACCRSPRSRPTASRVADLVARGRYPHQRLLRQWSAEDERAVREPRGARPASPTSPTGSSTSCRAVSGSACGSRWRSPRRRRCCCSTSRRRSSTSRTRSTCWTSAPSCTRTRAARWSRCSTTSTTPPATPRT